MYGDMISAPSIGIVWENLIDELLADGETVSPRGLAIREHRNITLCIDNARNNILICPQRRPNYRFMVAEWLWIWFGHYDVATIARYNPKIAAFSDDGVTFAGAYGPRIQAQWPRVVKQLHEDPDTRQAVIQIFDPNALNTKDVACTLSLQFMIRNGQLHTTAYMRSSDVWLGLPYDVFTFAMLGNIMASYFSVDVGSLTFHLGSSHLYARDLEAAKSVSDASDVTTLASPELPGAPDDILNAVLMDPLGPNWTVTKEPWKSYAQALCATTFNEALLALRDANAAIVQR